MSRGRSNNPVHSACLLRSDKLLVLAAVVCCAGFRKYERARGGFPFPLRQFVFFTAKACRINLSLIPSRFCAQDADGRLRAAAALRPRRLRIHRHRRRATAPSSRRGRATRCRGRRLSSPPMSDLLRRAKAEVSDGEKAHITA